jgi:hypothetical protein
MGLPELAGGGSSLEDLAAVCLECGSRLASIPYVDTVVAGRLLALAGVNELLPSVADGRILPTFVPRQVSDTDDPNILVPAGAVADAVVLLRGDDLILLQRPLAERPHTEPLRNFGSLPLAEWDIADPCVRISVLASGARAAGMFARATDEWRVLSAAALNGLRASALTIGLEYIKNRQAFGVLIASFQAVQHRLADLAVAGDGARLLAFEAAWAADNGRPNARVLASYAFVYSARTAFLTCREALQFHGGYGVTMEFDIQLYFRRARAWLLALGDPTLEEQRAAILTFTEEGL